MKKWLRRTRGAVGMGLTWAAGWAVAGILIGVSSVLLPALPWDAFFDVFDAPLPTLAIPGFVGGALFSVVLGIAARHRRFDELSLPRFAAWGAVGGLLLSFVPLALAGVDLLSGSDPSALVRATVVISGPFTILSALSATASLLLARRAQDRHSHRSGGDALRVAPSYSKAQQLLEGRGTARFTDQSAARPRDRARPDLD
jgi:hypothetical protein